MTVEAKTSQYTAFAGAQQIATGAIEEVAVAAAHSSYDAQTPPEVRIFDDSTGRIVDLDLRGTAQEIKSRLQIDRRLEQSADGKQSADYTDTGESENRNKPGRPKLGVVSREVTLLPRHWDWLNNQPGGASVAIRKLVEAARRDPEGKERRRLAQEITYRVMSTMAGDNVGFEEASRALFASNQSGFEEMIATWPADVQRYLKKLAAGAFN